MFKQIFDLPFIGMAITSAVSRRWLNFNDHLCTLLGYYFVVTIEDISERQAAQAKILTLNRLYRTSSECSAAVVRCRDEHEMFAEICRAAVESGGMKMAWVGLADTPTAMLQVVAAYGEGQDYLAELAISTDAADPRSHGPTGTAARTAEPVWCQDFLHDARTARWHASGARFGWGASAALPLQCGGRPVGALTLYTAEPNAFDQDVQILLLEIARAVSFGLDNFAREAARQQSEAQLRESEDRYRALFDNSQDAIMLAVPGGRILAANSAADRSPDGGAGAGTAQCHAAGGVVPESRPLQDGQRSIRSRAGRSHPA